MSRSIFRFITLLCLLLPAACLFAQQPPVTVTQAPAAVVQPPPFWNEIAAFKHQDSLKRPLSGAILLVGSSTFRKWTNVQDYFPNHVIINRGLAALLFPM